MCVKDIQENINKQLFSQKEIEESTWDNIFMEKTRIT